MATSYDCKSGDPVQGKKDKCQSLYLGQNKPGCPYGLVNEDLESSPIKRDLVVLINGKLNTNPQCFSAAKRANHVLGGIRERITSLSREGIVLRWSALRQPHLEYCVQFWASQYKDIKLLESVQRRAIRGVA
ncbi:hypothetical protein BTVI_39981 [Pitangus sulphuratus]|nr:hypothetical protein BTVI_39981 [Pitangus sulphuratus]